ncbi:putative succinate dehydrogenase [Rosellinia necatrix]|uniref:Putative succinate dehydrogenase n=1 Tax=Rosellinia necatrix TaxID=77044 RepID=A0A1W2TE43_ROSNE|nr:putative succinate dehydrogenase [Rosellinia necatrix]
MPIFQQDLDRDLMRRESADGGEQAGDPVENESISPAMSSPPRRQLDHGDDHRRHHRRRPRPLSRKLSEESIRTELCEGPVPDSPLPPSPPSPPLLHRDRDDISPSSAACTDRADLIQRLKRGESPAWIPHRYLFDSAWSQQDPNVSPTQTPTHKPTTTAATTSPALLPPPTITPEKDRAFSDDERRRQDGMNIERPRSALHSGDFTHDEASPDGGDAHYRAHNQTRQEVLNNTHSWISTSPPRDFTPFNFGRRQPPPVRSDEVRSALSSLSSSISTSFVYKPPTSPLFQSESNDDVDLLSPIDSLDIGHGLPRPQRRHTILSSLSGSYGNAPSPLQRLSPSFRQERTFPYQAHQPRRSLTATPSFSIPGFSSQTPASLQSRRPSLGSDVSPLHASMVGSYEESILRGRMSTTPSRPLDFLAQIGVLGLGKCKPNLRCPPHVTLPFPAVFYSYGSSSHGRSKEDDGPSPYVGQIDLENGLPNQEEDARSRKKHQTRAIERKAAEPDAMDAHHTDMNPAVRDARRAQRAKRRSGSPRAPPGGSYRIPEKGQVQIIIKNPNKTAVKLFLVPYDLAGMEPGTKTFVRQRSYSNGPIIDNMPELRDASSGDRPILRYLVHLHICCPSRGRFYLYKNIRVVFANRVPDGKEKLQNEITLPEPKFTPYKPIRVMHPPSSSGTGPGASLAADAASKRRSSGFFNGGAGRVFDMVEGFMSPSPSGRPFSYGVASDRAPVEPLPFIVKAAQARRLAEDEGGIFGTQSLESSQTSRPASQASGIVSNWATSYDGQADRYNKLNKGDVGYGGNAFAGLINGNPVAAESLLSQRLRSLGVEKPAQDTWETSPKLLEE